MVQTCEVLKEYEDKYVQTDEVVDTEKQKKALIEKFRAGFQLKVSENEKMDANMRAKELEMLI